MFNPAVGLDLNFVSYAQGVNYTLRIVLYMAAMLNTILLCGATKPAYVRNAYKYTWIAWAGMPEQIVVDERSDCGAEFMDYTSQHGIYHQVILVEAPCQHCMVERHGQALAGIIHALIADTSVVGT